MPDSYFIVAILMVLAIVAAAVWKPEATVMSVGVFLFVQSAVVRLDTVPDAWRGLFSRLDEIVLLVLVLRFVAVLLIARRLSLPPALWALGAFVIAGAVSALLNDVAILTAAIGIYLAIKPGLWLFVALHLRYDSHVVLRYAVVVWALFLAVAAVAAVQSMGVALPWEPHLRRSGELAASSIWNQHTVFGSAMAVAAGLSVLMLRLPNWRTFGAVLAIAAVAGVLMSTVRRLLVSLPVASISALLALPAGERARRLRDAAGLLQRPAVLALTIILLISAAALFAPRTVRVVADTWDEYVINAATRDRYALYRGGLELAIDSPLFGRGPGTFGSYTSVLFESPVYDEIGVRLPDSLKMGAPYASLLGEFGVLGTLTFAAFVLLALRKLLHLARSTDLILSRAFATAAIFMIANMAIESVVHVTFTDSFIAYFAFGCVGAAFALGGARTTGISATNLQPPGPRWVLAALVFSGILMLFSIGLVVALDGRHGLVADSRPNIVVIVSSQAAPEMLDDLERRGADGFSTLTNGGRTYTNARAAASAYSASLTSLLTGQLPERHGIWQGARDGGNDDYPGHNLEGEMLPNWLKMAGYRTAFLGRYLDGYGAWEEPIVTRQGHRAPGWDDWHAVWGAPAYYRYRVNQNGQIWGRGADTENYHTTDLVRLTELTVDANDGQPLLLFLAPVAPSDAATRLPDGAPGPVPAPRHEGAYGPVPPPDSGGHPTSAVVRASEQYGRGLETMLEVDRLVQVALAQTGGTRDTYLIFTSATGHGGYYAPLSGSPIDEALRIPLAIYGPSIPPGTLSPEPVNQTDVTATIVDLANASAPIPQDGRSLVDDGD